MAMTLDPATKVFTINQADLTLVQGTLYSADTDALRKEMMLLLASEPYIWMPDSFNHNTEVVVAGVTYARTLTTLNGYSYTFSPDSQWSVRLEGSNNDFWDIEAGFLNQNQVQVIPTNSAGLIVNEGQSLGQADLDNIADAVADEALAGHTTAGTLGKAIIDIEADTTSIEGKIDIIDTNVDALPTAADNADAVWDEQIDDHLAAGSTGSWLKNKVLTVAKYLGLS